MIMQHWDSDAHFRKRLTDSDPTLAKALTERNSAEVERIISERLKEVMAKKRAEQERIMKLRNADPNDVEA